MEVLKKWKLQLKCKHCMKWKWNFKCINRVKLIHEVEVKVLKGADESAEVLILKPIEMSAGVSLIS